MKDLASFLASKAWAINIIPVVVIFIIVIVIRTIVYGDPVSGWPSLVSIVLLVGGMQLFALGIIGQYIGKIYLETKKRPSYIIKEMK